MIAVIASSLTTLCPDNPAVYCNTGIPRVSATTSEVQTILQIVFGIIAAITVLIIVISGFRLVIAQGNPESVKKAREAIIAAIIGLVISLSAEILVSFVLGKF